jgi:hypothetical protein
MMRTLVPLLALFSVLPLVVSCGSSSPAGTWAVDTAATLEANVDTKAQLLAGVPDQMRERAEKGFDEGVAQMDVTMILAGDGTFSGIANTLDPRTGKITERKTNGTWSMDGDTVTITSADEKTGKVDTLACTVSGDTLRAVAVGNEGPAKNMILVLGRQ